MPNLCTVNHRGERWVCREEFAAHLLADGGLPLERWTAEGRVAVVKSGPHRTVYRIAPDRADSPATGLFVKRYRVAGWLGRGLHLVRKSRAELEWDAIAAVAAAGIPTVEPLAVGVSRAGPWVRESWLVTREIPGVVQLDELVECGRASRPGLRRTLAWKLGELIGRLHAAGLLHNDLHAGNLLVRAASDRLDLWLIDLHAVRRRRRVSWCAAERNLALFDHFFLGRAAATDRLEFFRGWRQAFLSGMISKDHDVRGWPGSERRAAPSRAREQFTRDCRRVETHCRAAEREAFARRDRKWRRGNRRLIVADTRTVRCRGLAGLGRELLTAIRERPDAAAELLSAAIRAGSVQGMNAAHISVRAFPVPASLGERLRRWLSDGPACHAWEMGHALRRRGIPAVRPLLCVETRSGRPHRSVLVCEGIEGGVPLAEPIRAPRGRVPRDVVAGCLEPFARALRRLHARGFVHESLDADCLVLQTVTRGGGPAVWLDGLHRVRAVRGVSSKRTIAQLARLEERIASSLELSRADRFRFLRTYFGIGRTLRCREAWRAVVNAASSDPASEFDSVVDRAEFDRAGRPKGSSSVRAA